MRNVSTKIILIIFSIKIQVIKQIVSFHDLKKLFILEKQLVQSLTQNIQSPDHCNQYWTSDFDLLNSSVNGISSVAVGLVYIQSHYNISNSNLLQGSFGPGIPQPHQSIIALDDVDRIIAASGKIGRIDLQIDWLEFTINNFDINENELCKYKNLLQHLKHLNDEILLKGGGFLFDKNENIFLVSQKKLKSNNTRNHDLENIAFRNIDSVEKSLRLIPHDKDMSAHPGFINKLMTVRADNTKRLCQISSSIHTDRTKGLFCKFHFINSFTRLCPYKFEILSVDPGVTLVHEFISSKEKTMLKAEAIEQGMLNTPYIVSGVHQKSSDKRSSKVAYLTDNGSNIARRISKRIETLTGLSILNGRHGKIIHSENFQVMNYGVGGTVQGHLDTLVTSKEMYLNTGLMDHISESGGDRIASFMIYLNEVHAGGNTVFPQTGISIKPESGSALLWLNMNNNGTFDTRSCHLGCPVLYGEKWIANKWIKMHGQMFKHKCQRF